MSQKQKYYVVWNGRQKGIFDSWQQCKVQVEGFAGAKYRSFETLALAEQAFGNKYEDYLRPPIQKPKLAEFGLQGGLVIPSYCVDASCIGNPGILEFRCVDTETGEEVFAEGPFKQGTNNVGEFLALVHALGFFQERGVSLPIYSDSKNAIGWVKKKKCKTRLIRDSQNIQLFDLITQAEAWLHRNSYQNEILKWNTQNWGENPADYKRK